MIPQHEPLFDKMDSEGITRVIKSGWVSEGNETKEFEKKFKEFVGTKYAITTTSGTVAIFLSLLASGIKPRDEVIIPNVTFVATATATKLAGAKPVLVEINDKDFTISVDAIRKNITKKTKAIIPVHLNGRSSNMDEIREIAQKNNLRVIEDASQALGSKYNKKYLGSIGDVGTFSLAPTKIITTGQGGMITTNKLEIFEKIKELKDQGRGDKSDHHPIVGFNFKFNDILAAIGNAQFSRLKKRISNLKKIHQIYFDLLKENKNVIIPPKCKESHLWYFDILVKNRGELAKYLQDSKIETRYFLKPISTHTPYKTQKRFFVSEQICSNGLFLPSTSNLTDNKIEFICKKINKFNFD